MDDQNNIIKEEIDLVDSVEDETASKTTSRTIEVNSELIVLQPDEFHTQDWLLITEALYKTTSPEYAFSNHFEERVQYARSLIPIVAKEADIQANNIYEHIDPKWGEIGPSQVDPSREIGHHDTICVDPIETDCSADSLTELDWLIIAEAMNAWIADLHLGGPSSPPRADHRTQVLMNSAIHAAGYGDVDDILPIVRELFEKSEH